MNRLHNTLNSPGSFLGRSKNKAVWIFADYSSYNLKLWPALCGGLVKNTEFNWLYWGPCWLCGGLAKSLGCSPQGENRKRWRTQNYNAAPLSYCHPNQFVYRQLLNLFRSLAFQELSFVYLLLFLIKMSNFCPMLSSHDADNQSLSWQHSPIHTSSLSDCTLHRFLFSLQHPASLLRHNCHTFHTFFTYWCCWRIQTLKNNTFRPELFFFLKFWIFFMPFLYFSAFDKHLCKINAILFCTCTHKNER